MKLFKVCFTGCDCGNFSYLYVANSKKEALERARNECKSAFKKAQAYEINNIDGYAIKLVKMKNKQGR